MKLNQRPKSSNWRIVIPDLRQYKDATDQRLMQLRHLILQRLKRRPQQKQSNMKSEFDRGLRYYHVAVQRHANGVPHLDVLLIYEKSLLRKLTDFDYLLKHGNVTTYRRLNQAILAYGKKQDSSALSNLPDDHSSVIQLQTFKSDPYLYLQRQMLKDSLRFNVEQYVRKHDLDPYVTGWSSVKNKLKDMQNAAANLLLRDKPGFKFISRGVIQSSLSEAQLKVFDSWKGYQTVVDFLNVMVVQKGRRQQKSLNLLVTGPPNCGKSALVWQRDPLPGRSSVSFHCSVYPMGMDRWFPKYQSDVYHCIYWNQAKLTSYSYDTVLKLLDGSPLDLPSKGGSSRKVDNPLVIMTSNMTLDQMIVQKFGYNKSYADMARSNLAVRVKNVVVPSGYDLFLLQKLLVPNV